MYPTGYCKAFKTLDEAVDWVKPLLTIKKSFPVELSSLIVKIGKDNGLWYAIVCDVS